MDANEDWTPCSFQFQHEVTRTNRDEDRYKLIQGWLKKYAPKKAKILDVGCGIAAWTLCFEHYDYTGIDQCEQMLVFAEENSKNQKNVSFQLLNACDMKFKEEFDITFTAAVLQHSKHSQKNIIVENIYNALRPGGLHIMTEVTFTPENYHVTGRQVPFTEHFSDGNSFTPEGWERYMRSFGFESVVVNEPFSYYLWRKRE